MAGLAPCEAANYSKVFGQFFKKQKRLLKIATPALNNLSEDLDAHLTPRRSRLSSGRL